MSATISDMLRGCALVFALVSLSAATGDQAKPALTLTCQPAAIDAMWAGTAQFGCLVKPVEQAPSAQLKLSCLAPAGITCEVDPPTSRLTQPPATYLTPTVKVTYSPALAPGISRLEIRADVEGLPATAYIDVVKNLNTLSSHCPSAADLQTIDRDLRLIWDSDPTKGTVACRKADGSRDLTVMQSRVYRALHTMKQMSFNEPLPWTRDPVYRWLTRTVRGLHFRSDVTNSSCCSSERLINVRAVVMQGPSGGQQGFALAITSSQMPTDFRTLASFLQLLVHEARHADGKPHTCGSNDQTYDEMGAWAAAHAFQTWMADKMAPDLMPDLVRTNLRQQANQICKAHICQGCKAG